LNISYWARVRAQRRTARQIHAGTYKPSPIGAKARAAAKELHKQQIPSPVPPPAPPKGPRIDYWGSDRYELITRVQRIKRIEIQDRGYQGSIHNTDRYVEINPVTGAQVPIEDLKYAATHMSQLMRSGAIREDRWAFLWYH